MTVASRFCLHCGASGLRVDCGILGHRSTFPNLFLRRPHTSSKRSSLLYTPLATRSYIANSASTSDKQSTVFRGTSFENRCLYLLEAHLGMALRRVGGKEDGGVDLNGWWLLPDVKDDADNPLHPHEATTHVDSQTKDLPLKRIRILVQCKAEKKKIGPKYVRELEGVAWRYIALEKNNIWDSSHSELSNESTPVVAVFLSESPFTKSTILRAMSSQVPFLLIYVPPLAGNNTSYENSAESEEYSGPISSPGSCIYNPALGASNGLFKGKMEVRWCCQTYGAPALFFRGSKLRGWVPPGLGDFHE
ncbi:hypothetical protein J3R30DRAFT_3304643 [Lentinula aciculospora]|uniref:Required for respiratory growth protein 7, mitochondrial n=1 Tax=Lentinula aciculospora TaxID=153920 RepID=A0A9W9DG35_9AGAR|nr:hypothetical protein J3R30DRAFT_3304643 [Lentinula aciculospora]